MDKQLVIDFDRLDGIRKGYKVKAGDKIVRWVFTYNKGWVGKVTRSWRRSEGEVLSVDGDVINVRIDDSEFSLSVDHLIKDNIYETIEIDASDELFEDVYYTIIPSIFLVADYNEIPEKVAENAYRNTSFDPDKRGFKIRYDWEIEVNEFAAYLYSFCDNDAKKEKAVSLRNTFHDKSKSLLIDYLYSHANCISVMITGGSNFPTRRAQKASDAADKKWNDYAEYVKNAREKYPKIIQETLTSEEKEEGLTYEKKEFFKKLDNDLALAKQIAERPKGSVPSYIRTNMNSALLSRLDTLWRNRDYETFNKALDKIKESGLIFSKNNAIWERHANTPTSELYQSPEFKHAYQLIENCENLTKDEFEKDKEDIQWSINSTFNHLNQQNRIRSIKILLQKIKDLQSKTGFVIYEPDAWVWRLQKEDEGEEVDAPSSENPEGGTIYEADGCEVVDNIEQQRVQIMFPGKPSSEIISYLKSNGFRWSPFNKAWQRQNTPVGIHKALEFAKKFFPKGKKKEDSEKGDKNELQLAKAKMKMAAARLKMLNMSLGEITYEMD